MTTKNNMFMMLDIETLDTKSTAVVPSIGAVIFDSKGVNNARFYITIDVQSCIDAGLTISGNTLGWWARQSEDARKIFNDKQAVPLKRALQALQNYVLKTLSTGKLVHLVGNSARFDIGIIENAYLTVGLKPFWNPFLERDYRTWKSMGDIAGVDKPQIVRADGGTNASHNALQDALEQANHVIELNKYYGGILL